MKKILWSIIVIIVASFAIYFQHTKQINFYRYSKILTTFLIFLVPVLFFNSGKKKYKTLILIGLLFCLIGDAFLLYNNYFIAGLISFLLAHIIFTYAFILIDGFNKKYGVLALLLLICSSFFIILKASLGDLLIPVAIYMLVIVCMNWQAISLYLKKKNVSYLLLSFGAVLFLISDSILAYDKFKEPFSFAGILILITYWVAIGLFAFSTLKIKEV